MIVCVSIVDRHRPEGDRHVGTYTFEIGYPAATHPGQMDFYTADCPAEGEAEIRHTIGKLLRREEIPRCVHAHDGSPA